MKWLRILVILPPSENNYLVYDEIFGICIAYYRNEKWYFRRIGLAAKLTKVTHWMELPKKPWQ